MVAHAGEQIAIPPKNSRRWVSHSVVAQLKQIPFLLPALKNLFHWRNRLRFGSTIRRNAALRNTEAHRPMALLGTGLSLLAVDVTRLNGLALFGCNEVFKHGEFSRMRLDYYTAPVPYFGRLLGAAYVEDFRQLLSEIDRAFRGRDTRLLLHASWKPFLRRRQLLSNSTTSFFLAEGGVADDDARSNDLSAASFAFGGGALSVMIAAAVFMGVKEIFLLGCGYAYSPRMHSHFFDALSVPVGAPESEVNAAVARFGALYPGYDITRIEFGDRRVWFSPTNDFDDGDATAALYRRLRRLAESRGVRVVNVVPPGYESKIFDGMSTAEFNSRFLRQAPTSGTLAS